MSLFDKLMKRAKSIDTNLQIHALANEVTTWLDGDLLWYPIISNWTYDVMTSSIKLDLVRDDIDNIMMSVKVIMVDAQRAKVVIECHLLEETGDGDLISNEILFSLDDVDKVDETFEMVCTKYQNSTVH